MHVHVGMLELKYCRAHRAQQGQKGVGGWRGPTAMRSRPLGPCLPHTPPLLAGWLALQGNCHPYTSTGWVPLLQAGGWAKAMRGGPQGSLQPGMSAGNSTQLLLGESVGDWSRVAARGMPCWGPWAVSGGVDQLLTPAASVSALVLAVPHPSQCLRCLPSPPLPPLCIQPTAQAAAATRLRSRSSRRGRRANEPPPSTGAPPASTSGRRTEQGSGAAVSW